MHLFFLQTTLKPFTHIFFSNVYPASWGDGMHEVVAGDGQQRQGTEWVVTSSQLPNIGDFLNLPLLESQSKPYSSFTKPSSELSLLQCFISGLRLLWEIFSTTDTPIGGFWHILRSDYSLPVTKRVQLDMN